MPQFEPSNSDTCVSSAFAGRLAAIDREAVVHRHDLDLAGGEVLDRMVGAMMALRHLDGPRADREPQELMAEADAEQGHLRLQERLDRRHGVFAGGRRVAGSVGEHDPVGLERQDVLGARRRRNHRHRAAAVVEQPQDIALGPVVDRDDVKARRLPPAIAAFQRPARLVPIVALGRAHRRNEVHAVDAGPGAPPWRAARRGRRRRRANGR